MATSSSLPVVVVVISLVAFVSSAIPEERHKVVIVGAGVSGFATATTLLSHNLTDFVVLEASDRVGGRIHTVEFGGVLVDKGAEFVHGEEDNVVFDLVSPHGLLASYEPLTAAEGTVYTDVTGRKFNSSLVHTLLDRARDILYQNYSDYSGADGSVAGFFYPRLKELLEAEKVEPDLGEGLRHLITNLETVYSAADDLGQLGVRGEGVYVENGGDRSLKWKSRGYKTLFEILSKKFPNPSEELPVAGRILFHKEVVRVEREGGEVVVRCGDGSSYRADHVIVTVSLGVLKKRGEMFSPALPRNKTDAIQSLGIGCVGKVFLLFPSRWWPKEVNVFQPIFSDQQLLNFKNTSQYGNWSSYTTGFWPVMQHERMLCAWLSGDACRTVETLEEDDVIEGLTQLLQRLVGEELEVPRPEGMLRTNWASNPYTLGSYSFHTPYSDRLNITRGHLSEPLYHGDKPVVLFAGEATHPHYWGTVHGALTTGVREANCVLRTLSPTT